MGSANKSFYQLQKDNAELRKELKYYKELSENRLKNIKQINVKNSHNSFYKSKEWKELRYKVLMKHKLSVGSVCILCKQITTKLHVDHIQPRSKRPDLELCIDNLQVLCHNCNIGKSNKDSTDWTILQKKEDHFE